MVSGEKTIREYKKRYSSARKSRRYGEKNCPYLFGNRGKCSWACGCTRVTFVQSVQCKRKCKKRYSSSRKSRRNGENMLRMFWPTGKVFRSMSMPLLKCPSDLAVMTSRKWTSPQRSGLLSPVSSMLQELSRAIHSTRGSWWLKTCYAKTTLFHVRSGLKRGRTK